MRRGSREDIYNRQDPEASSFSYHYNAYSLNIRVDINKTLPTFKEALRRNSEGFFVLLTFIIEPSLKGESQ